MLTLRRRCILHAATVRRAQDSTRPTAARRGYDAAWRRLRGEVLARDPVCSLPWCQAPSVDVDHVVSRARGGEDALENLRGLCHAHHSRKTVERDMRRGARGRWR